METAIANATLKALRRILRATDGGNRKLAAATGLTPSQLLVLREVEARDEATPGSIAQRLQFSHATITAIADRLVDLGLITRTRGERDKRQILLNATAEGRQRLTDAPDMLQEIFAERFAALPAELRDGPRPLRFDAEANTLGVALRGSQHEGAPGNEALLMLPSVSPASAPLAASLAP